MRIHYCQHASFENLDCIDGWVQFKGYHLSGTLLFAGESLPSLDDLDWLIVMGGPMNIYEIEQYPWLVQEKEFIKAAIVAQKKVLGICLGGQLIADVLSAPVTANSCPEIGWFPVQRSAQLAERNLLPFLPPEFVPLHWHGDTFALPAGAIPIGSSAVCANQGYLYGDRVIGLQFHLEFTKASLLENAQTWQGTIAPGPYSQSLEFILSQDDNFTKANELMFQFLDYLDDRA
jgi:GMP synthase (glutamine-hydrolysing)